ncbi:MAG TPA: septum formation initiator family protein [Gemmatimonadaceae bacterium]|nr:septum formation initiator family protein [Gemmatimonadaceae bacterium]
MAKSPRTGRVIWIAVIAGAVLFAVQGGEYTSADLVRQRFEERRLQRAIDSLRLVNDSLQRALDAALNDRETQERIAREEFGMVRGDREILYRFAEPADRETTPR